MTAIQKARDVGEEPVAWQRRQRYALRSDTVDADPWRECSAAEATGHFERKPGYEYRPLYSATALERVVRERDEARAWRKEIESASAAWMEETGQAYCYVGIRDFASVNAKLKSAEAKLAEARKVIEPFAALEPPKHCRAFMQILVCPEGDTTPGDYSPHIRAARRFLEETK